MASRPPLPSVADVVSLAVTLHQSGHLDEAEELYSRALERAPDHVDAQHFLGVLQHQRGDSEKAVHLIRKALHANPSYHGARINLGNVLKESERFPEAETEYRRVIDADDRNAEAHNNLGAVLRAQKKNEEAVASYQRAIALQPKQADFYQNLGNALRCLDRTEEALTAFRQAVEIDPNHTRAHLSLGRALYAFRRIDEAIIVYQQWLQVEPDNPIAQHMLAACKGDEIPVRCSDEYVKQSFDAFASSFDEVLDRLEYRAPKLIERAIGVALPLASGELKVLDAGCGTGLCGESLRRFASELVGIDLSPKMLVKARARHLYDRIEEVELTEFMSAHPSEFDLIVSADTLVYFGDLAPALDAACRALRPGGVLAFTVERNEKDSDVHGFRLNPHGRYSHTESYVVQCLQRVGLNVASVEDAVLRLESRSPVDGLVVTAEKPS